MNKREFIERLRTALSGRIPAPQVEDTVNYYQDYINVEMRKGRSEEEVLQSLGDPRLIARTIIQTNGGGTNGFGTQGGAYQESRYQEAGYQETGYQEADYQNVGRQEYGYRNENDNYGYHRRSFRIPGWLLGVLILVAVFLIFNLIFSVLSFLAPVLIVMAAVIFMIKLFRDWLN